MFRTAFVTNIPSHYSVQIFNELARRGDLSFRVFYLRQMSYGRLWKKDELPIIEHDAVFIPEVRLHKHLYLSPGLLPKYLQYSPDLLVVTQYASIGMQELMWLESMRRKPWIMWAEAPHVQYNDDPIIPHSNLGNILRSNALVPVKRWAREVWGIGSTAVNAYRALVKPSIPVRNMPYYFDIKPFIEAGKQRSSAAQIRFLYCGSLSRRKGTDLLAEAVVRLCDEGFDFKLMVAGAGPLESCMKLLAPEVLKKVILLGFVPLPRVPVLYIDADVLLLPSRYDGWGLTVIEGMAAGQTVVSTHKTGAAVDSIIDGCNGLLMTDVSATALYLKMRWCIQNPDAVKVMGLQAKQTANSYSSQLGAGKMADMLNAMATG